jgi:hypothetical protein
MLLAFPLLAGCGEVPTEFRNIPTPGLSVVPDVTVPSPVTYWPADGHYNDIADGDNNGTPLGTVGFAPGKVGQAFQFDGSSELEVAHSDDLELADGNASMSISAWVKPTIPFPSGTSASGLGPVFTFNNACSDPWIVFHAVNPAGSTAEPAYAEGMLFSIRDLDAVLSSPVGLADVFRDSDWHHFVAVRDGPGDEVRLFIDGVLRGARFDGSGTVVPLRNAAGEFITQIGGTTLQSLGTNSPDRIGANPTVANTHCFGPNLIRRYVGLIDDIKVWDVALTAEQVGAEYHRAFAPPVISALKALPNPAPVGSTVGITALVDDAEPGASPIVSAEYSVDGGTFGAMYPSDGAFDEVSEAVNASLGPFPTAGVHEVCVRATDSASNVAESECILLAVYDSNGGFVTGGGWINSPAGAYAAAPALSGKANFGFVSKYKPGATVPTGNTEFQFKAGALNFHSGEYDWLVVAGARAQFKGRGQINGAGDYQFLLTAIDGAVVSSRPIVVQSFSA